MAAVRIAKAILTVTVRISSANRELSSAWQRMADHTRLLCSTKSTPSDDEYDVPVLRLIRTTTLRLHLHFICAGFRTHNLFRLLLRAVAVRLFIQLPARGVVPIMTR